MSLLNRVLKKKEEKQPVKEEKKSAPKTASVVPAAKKSSVTRETGVSAHKAHAGRIIVRPLVTEKAAHAEGAGVYSFVVTGRANKIQIAQAVKALYGVAPVAVRIINTKGKNKRFGGVEGKRKDVKKALVTLQKGATIAVHENV